MTREDEFFIGWLPAPPGHARMASYAGAGALFATAALALAITTRQGSPGRGIWESGQSVSLDGVAVCQPYPLLRVLEPNDPSGVRTHLVVGEGKFGALERLRPFDGKPVSVRGTLLRRDGRWLLELASDAAAVRAAASLQRTDVDRLRWPARVVEGPITLQGEVIDPKCFLGAMKPGSGKTHKACATLCISGGIPPMLFVVADGHPVYYLVATADGSTANEKILPYVGDIVEVEGRAARVDDLRVLFLEPGSIRRL